jgi:transposase
MEQQVENVAGLDVHRETIVASARLGRGEHPKVAKGRFKTTTAGVDELGRWLADLEVTRVVTESTWVY